MLMSHSGTDWNTEYVHLTGQAKYFFAPLILTKNYMTCFEVMALSITYALQCTHCINNLLLEAMSGGNYRVGALRLYSRPSLAVGASQPLPLAPQRLSSRVSETHSPCFILLTPRYSKVRDFAKEGMYLGPT